MSAPLMTVEEFLPLPQIEGQRMELIGGRVITGDEVGGDQIAHEWVKSNLIELLADWVRQHPSLKLFSGTVFQLDERNARISDVSVMSRSRKPVDVTGLLQGGPDLAIAVVSSESTADLNSAIDLFLAHGSKSVWVAYPELRTIWIFDPSGHARQFQVNQVLQDPTLPGFRAPVSEIFEGI